MNAETLPSFNLDTMNIKTRGVEAALAPIVKQIRKLINPQQKKRRHRGQSKKALILVQALEVATDNFVWRGESIAEDVPEAKADVLAAVKEIRSCGAAMSVSAREFATDPCSQEKRNQMVLDARLLLAAVARLLIIADMIDVHMLMSAVYAVNTDIDFIRQLASPPDLMEGMRRFQKSVSHLGIQAGRRQAELKDRNLQDNLASARAVLKKSTPLLFTACNVHVRYPNLERSRENRELVLMDVCRAVDTIGEIAEGRTQPNETTTQPSVLELLSELRLCLQSNPDWVQSKQFIEERVEDILRRSDALVKTEHNSDRQAKFAKLCTEIRSCYPRSSQHKEEDLERSRQKLLGLLDALSSTLKTVVLNQVSDQFLELCRPVNSLMAAAKKGKQKETSIKANLLSEQCEALATVAAMVTQLTLEEEQRKLIQLAAGQLKDLCTEVGNAGLILADIPNSKAALENSDLFRTAWINQVRILVDAVDVVIPLGQFLDILENHIIRDVRHCCQALEERQPQELSRSARSVYHRTLRVCDLAVSDLENYEPGPHSERLLEAVENIKKHIFPLFSQRVQEVLKAMKQGLDVDENEFIDGTRMVYDGVRDVRRVVSLYYTQEDEVADTEWELIGPEPQGAENQHFDKGEKKEITSIRDAVQKIPEQDKLAIAKELEIADHVYWVAIWSNPRVRNLLSTTHLGGSQVDGFHEEKERFDREVEKWEESENDIVLLAKHMCRIMLDMTDFIKGKGPLTTTQEIIAAAKKISESGKKLDSLARKIADRCPESSTKNDLLAYLQRIALYCHQLNITSKVKADIHSVSGEFIVSGLDSACSLIQAARNLMNAVVLTVKASYVASRMYKGNQGLEDPVLHPVVVWKMKTPEKQPLVKRELPEDFRAKVKRYSRKEQTSPMKALSEFEEDHLMSFPTTSTESLASTNSHK